ncbi:MAG: hypothetical protein NT133_16295 [Alphaproteobacteria bacterium]|nr:hypothetical protein [Alphaproteobacteria bacterium]
MSKIATRPVPSALPPSAAELAAWQFLIRDEQIARTRDTLLAPEARRVSEASMDDVLIVGRKRVAL